MRLTAATGWSCPAERVNEPALWTQPPAGHRSRVGYGLEERRLLLVGQAVNPHLLAGREGPAA